MSNTTNPRATDVTADEREQAITFKELVAAVRRHPNYPQPGASDHASQWVLVNDDDEVLASFSEFGRMRRDFYKRLDDDPVAALNLRVYRVTPDGAELKWPTNETEVERAKAAARSFRSRTYDRDSVEVFLGAWFLRGDRGTMQIRDHEVRCVEVWWPDLDGTRDVIGYLVEKFRDYWLFCVSGEFDSRPSEQIVESRIAQAVNEALGRDDISADVVHCHRRMVQEGAEPAGLPQALIRMGIELAQNLGVLGYGDVL